jgi:hypothetical protein
VSIDGFNPLRHLVRVDDALHVVVRRFGIPSYDFDLERFLPCSHPVYVPDGTRVIARVGPIADYPAFCQALREVGLEPLHDELSHERASDLRRWAPLLADLTPHSVWEPAPGAATARGIADSLGFPLFVKTVEQTLRHRRDIAIVRDVAALQRSIEAYRGDPVLGSQPLVFRELVTLRPAPNPGPDERVPAALELRAFVLLGECVGLGPYWRDGGYAPSEEDMVDALVVVMEAARHVDVPFVVVDVAQKTSGEWIVIECNDAQESGFCAIPPLVLFQAMVDRARRSLGIGASP